MGFHVTLWSPPIAPSPAADHWILRNKPGTRFTIVLRLILELCSLSCAQCSVAGKVETASQRLPREGAPTSREKKRLSPSLAPRFDFFFFAAPRH